MTEPTQVENESAGRLADLYSTFPFLREMSAAQSQVPGFLDVQGALLRSIIDADSGLPQDQKAAVINAIVYADKSPEAYSPEFGSAPSDSLLLKFAWKLAAFAPFVSQRDIIALAAAGFSGSGVIETVATVAAARFFRALRTGLGVEIEPASAKSFLLKLSSETPPEYVPSERPYVPIPATEPGELKSSFSLLREQFGFVPNLLRIQSVCPTIVKAEVETLDAVLFSEDLLTRLDKEQIILRVASQNFDPYLVAVHSRILCLLGMTAEECDQVIDNLGGAPLAQANRILLEELGKISLYPTSASQSLNRDPIYECGFTEAQVIEGIVLTAFTSFLSTVQFGLGPLPDFPCHRNFIPNHLYPFTGGLRPTFNELSADDPDSDLVAEVKAGNTDAFADLVRRHTRRVFGTLFGVVGNVDDARDSTQDVFLKAFQKIDRFEGRSKFSTWLTSIAVNTGTELLRHRRPTESIDDADNEQGFRPRQLQSWVDDPEQQLAKAQMNELVRKAVLRLPEKYRIALLLRDINQFSTEDAAAALGVSVAALKARVLRGRLMLRESLAPHFSHRKGNGDV
jgi:RNA polymerase sigma-70 factor, ECF subfamily